ncbi:hypothetical protein K435DRAFT_969699 [Dendrothele bispora CBS 962.96]|uniref:Uncharacterized protein n=1 Tax=Dendrothele bispora (strain CBS 962.96) TaxID=1314807 RepID=A0A4S8LFX8_DENBC|nr:hypothetical protein K435DRAFT_969699 [Dendrothele bispora CBS 962.96]
MEESTDELDDFSFDAPALTRNELKSARGINHPLTRAFLIPFGFIDRVYYQEDGAEACKKVFDDLKKGAKNAKKNRGKGKKGRNAIVQDDSRGIPLESDSLCAFMYFINSYDSGKVWSGLLRGPLLVIAYRAIFTGPSSALGEKGAPTKSGNAKIHGVSEVSFESIAYVAAQVRFALCSKNSWVKEDGVFNLECFYFYLLDLMLKAPTKWGDELLEFWNDAVFGDASTVPDSLGEPRPDSDMARALKQFTRDFMNDDEGVDGGDEDVDGGGESS